MSDVVVRVEGLGKRYRIRHERTERYTALRDVLAERVRRLLRAAPARTPVSGVEDFWALHDVSFDVRRGEVMGIIGRNGAGKSTLLKILSRITEPTTGRAMLEGRVASLLEVGTGFHPELTGRENVFLNGAILGMRRTEIKRKFAEIVAFAEVEKFLDTPVKHYSSGMYVRLAFAVAAHLEPEILIVDEVLAVGDTLFQQKCLGKIGEVARSGRTVLFVSHQMATVEHLCQTGLLLDHGRATLIGSARDVIAAYSELGAPQATQSLADRADRSGNGSLRFSGVRLLDDRGVPLGAFICGADVVMELQVHNVHGAPLRQLHVSVGVDNALGQRVTTWSTTYSRGEFPVTPAGDFVVSVRLPRLALLPGAYTFNLFATTNMDIADWLRPAGSFNVDGGDYYGTGQLPGARDGVFLTEHSFELEPLDVPAPC
jgi:lipopolysaccharide transport system ATP-binding protein